MNRREAIETLKKAIAQVEWDYPMEIAAALDFAIADMKICEANNAGWISVKDRMPESGKHVLVCCEIHPLNPNGMSKKRYICDGYYAAEHSIADDCRDYDFCDAYDYDEEEDEYYLKEGWYEVIKNWDEYSSVVIEDFVTYWMPLPELPKEDDENG